MLIGAPGPGQIFVLPISVTAERMRLQDHTDKNKTSEEPPLRKKKRKKKPPLRQNERLVSVRVGCFENLWRSGARGPEPREARRRFLKRLGGEGNHRGGCDEEEGSQVREEEDGSETGRLVMDAGLGSLSAKDASELVGGSNAVMVDARTGDMHLLLSAGLSGASRWQWNWRQVRGA